MNYREAAEQVYADLLSRSGEGDPKPRLEATRRAVALLGDPHQSAPVIHITGTNGKTSTARIIESLLLESGLRTGLLSSPHLLRFTERIRIDGESVSDETVSQVWNEIKDILKLVDQKLIAENSAPLSFFEALTILGFACFADAPVDVLILEVGMGGEWDATNVADGVVAVFTPIDLDHQARLGNTIELIARTKSGIIKPASSVVSARQKPEVLTVLKEAAVLRDSSITVEDLNFQLLITEPRRHGQELSISGTSKVYDDLFLPMMGEHQAQNAMVAVVAVEKFLGGRALDEEIVREGLRKASSPGRLHQIALMPPVYVDAAHNLHGVNALISALDHILDYQELVLVFSAFSDKNAGEMLHLLLPRANRVILSQPDSERAITVDELRALVSAAAFNPPEVTVLAKTSLALAEARKWAAVADGRVVLCTGSVALVGEIMKLALDQGWAGK